MNIPAEYIPLVVSIFVFFSLLMLIIVITLYYRRRDKQLSLIKKIRHEGVQTEIHEKNRLQARSDKKSQNRFLNFFSSMGKSVVSEKSEDFSKMRLKLIRAGIRNQFAPGAIWGIKCFLAAMLPIAFFLTAYFIFPKIPRLEIPEPYEMIACCVFMAVAGFYLPGIWLFNLILKRKGIILKGFPDALDLMVVCVEAGLGLDAALNRVAKEIKLSCKELSDELNLYLLELNAGKLRRDALKSLAMRIDIDDVRNMITLINQADKFGTSVSKSLRVYSDTLRTKRMQRAEEMAAKLTVKLIIPLILFIFPALFVVIMGPALIRLLKVL